MMKSQERLPPTQQFNPYGDTGDDKFFSMQRGKSHTISVKSKLKSGNRDYQQGYRFSQQNVKLSEKERVTNQLYEIEENFKNLKHLPNQRLHPFDLSQEELAELKTHFPEFSAQVLSQKRQKGLAKGIEVSVLQELLSKKILISSEKMSQIIAKLDHKASDRITWTEFLGFMTNEGLRREAVNDAQLYGLGVKRLEEKDRFKLLRNNDQSLKATEYYVESITYMRVDKQALVLAVFENNQARLYDTRDFTGIQEIAFPFEVQAKKLRPRTGTSQHPTSQHKQRLQSGGAAEQSAEKGKASHHNLIDFLQDQPLESIPEKKVRKLSKERAKSAVQKTRLPMSQHKNKLHLLQHAGVRVHKKDEGLRRNSSEEEIKVIARADPAITAWKSSAYIKQMQAALFLKDSRQKEEENRHEDKILGLADMSSFYPQPANENQKVQQSNLKMPESKLRASTVLNQDHIRNKQKYQNEFNQKMNDVSNELRKNENLEKANFDKLLKREKKRKQPYLEKSEEIERVFLGNPMNKAAKRVIRSQVPLYLFLAHFSVTKERLQSEKLQIENVVQKMKFKSDQVDILIVEKQKYQLEESLKNQDRCKIKLDQMTGAFKKQDKKLQELTKVNQPRQKLVQDQTQIDLDELEDIKRERKNVQYQQHHTEGQGAKKVEVKTTKAVHVTACNYNESQQLLAIALIDKEVKIYTIRQNGTKHQLCEQFSFFLQFPSGAAASCLQIDRYITNGRPIICIGTSSSDIAIYYLDDEPHIREKQGGPTCLKKFCFVDRQMKYDALDDLLPEQAKNEKQGRISFKKERPSAYQNQNYNTANHQTSLGGEKNKQFNDYGDYQYSNYFRSQVQEGNKKRRQITSATRSTPQMESIQLITDEYWDSVVMNTKDKQDGPDGIQLWNLIYPQINNYSQCTALVKELAELNVKDLPIIQHLVQIWLQCVRMSYGVVSDAQTSFRIEAHKLLESKPNFKDLPSSTKQPKSSQNGSFHRSNRKQSFITSNSQQRLKSGASTTQPEESTRLTSLQYQKRMPTTALRYVKDIGLIVTTFDGQLKMFDSFNFYTLWKSSNKTRKANQHTTITCFDVSPQLGLMVVAGVEGKLVLIDPYALGIINQTDAIPNVEILNVYIYTQQQQIIVVAQDRSIIVFDAFRLDRIQTIRDQGQTHAIKFTSVDFDHQTGQLFVGCQQMNIWKAVVDCKTEIQALQVQTLSKTMMQERNMFELEKLGGKKSQTLSTTTDQRTGKVVVSAQSQLVSIIINKNDKYNLVVSVDSDNLLRGWNMRDCSTSFSYKIPFKSRVTAAAADDKCRYVAVGTCVGEVAILNFSSGGVLYHLPHQDKEITCLRFLKPGLGEFWLVAGTWGGKIIFWTEPSEDNKFQISAKCKIGHRGDVLVIDSAYNFIVTGGVDGFISVWNQFSGQLKFPLDLPDPVDPKNPQRVLSKAEAQLQKRISSVMFHPYWSNIICVLQMSGNVHLVDISNQTIAADNVAFTRNNASWARNGKTRAQNEDQRVFVMGEMGKCALFDIKITKKSNEKPKMNGDPILSDVDLSNYRWQMISKEWKTAHVIGKTDNHFVQSVSYAENVDIWVSATSAGEVRLWKNNTAIDLLGTLNSKQWIERQCPLTRQMVEGERKSVLKVLEGEESSREQSEVAIDEVGE